MAITQAPPVHEQPHVELRDWIIVQRFGGYHLVGYCVDKGTIRRRTSLLVFDAEQQTCRTQSGRHYQLVSPPATGDVVQELQCFAGLSLFDGVELHDVTAAILDQPLLVLASVLKDLPDRPSAPGTLLARAQARASRPKALLSMFAKALISCDIDPHQHHRVAGISEVEWQRCLHDVEAVIPVAAVLRVLLVLDILYLVSQFFGERNLGPWLHRGQCNILGLVRPKDVLLAESIDPVTLLHHEWRVHCFSGNFY